MWKECVTYHKVQSHEFQMAIKHVEYSMAICVFGNTKCMIMLYMTM